MTICRNNKVDLYSRLRSKKRKREVMVVVLAEALAEERHQRKP